MTTTDPALIARAMSCRDVEAGRISIEQYRATLEPTKIDSPYFKPVIIPSAPQPQWAASVRAVSSEWSPTSWSAFNVLGAPDVYPQHGDLAKAWASREQDAPTEFIEVGFAEPAHASALQVAQTFNPGAIAAVELITASGQHIQIAGAPNTFVAGSTSRIDTFSTACTSEPIVAARVTLNSAAVPGWNEIDAIGLVGCKL